MDYEQRIAKVAEGLGSHEAEALLVTNLSNVRYLTGFSGTSGAVLVTSGDATFFSDGRYAARAAAMVKGAAVRIYKDRLTELLPAHLEGVSRLGFEAETVTVAARDRIAGELEGVELVATSGVVEALRRRKDPEELDAIRRAVEVSDAAYAFILDRLRPGAVERDIALQLEVHMRNAGAEDVSFEPIVGSGPLSAHIHHTPSERAFEKGDLVLLDLGARCDGYCSDLTRTVVLGPATDEQRATYDLVLTAQRAAIDRLGPEVPAPQVDGAARDPIEEAGEGEAFGHGLGHGVGLEVHEAPRLARTSEDVLAAGDVVTIEPGVYHPASGGIRIEDCVAVTGSGAEVLTAAPKDELIEL